MERGRASLILLAFLVASVSGRTATRISGGTQTEAENVPYQVAIVKNDTTTLRCGGALIRPNVVLTTAYCASLLNTTDTEVMVGNSNLTRQSPSLFAGVKEIRIHKEYDPQSRKNDIALLKLTYDLTIQQPAVDIINIRESAFPVTAICNLTGWGSDTWNGKSPGRLQRLELSAVDYVICSWILKQPIEVGQFCGGGKEGENGCFLDEGDPLVCDGELAGIMSQSFNCGVNNKPSVYTEVYKYRDWIDATIESMNSAAVTSLSSCISTAMPVALVSYWKCRA